MRWKSIWMYRGGEAGQAFEEGVGGGVEKLVGDAVDVAVGDGAQRMPVALLDDASQGDAIAGAAPGEDEDFGVTGCDGLCSGGFACVADEFAAGSLDQLLDPGLRMNQRLAPFFAIDAWTLGDGLGLKANGVNGRGEFGDQVVGTIGSMDDGADEANVREDVSEGVRGQRQHGTAGAENGGQRFHAVGTEAITRSGSTASNSSMVEDQESAMIFRLRSASSGKASTQ